VTLSQKWSAHSVACSRTIQDRMGGMHFLPPDSLCAHFSLHERLIAEEVTAISKRFSPKGRHLALEDARKTSLRPDFAHRVPGSIIQSWVGWLRL
jgi:hypothetical protein